MALRCAMRDRARGAGYVHFVRETRCTVRAETVHGNGMVSASLPASRIVEDLPRLAAEAYRLASGRCGSCRDAHALWPYIRLARASIGVETAESSLEVLLSDLFAGGRRKALIAGSQDTGLLTLVARAGAGRGVDITVADRCDTPLEMCRRLAQEWSLPIATVRTDLVNLDAEHLFDVALVHGTLHFMPAESRPQVLARLARALRPDGRLVLQFTTNRPVPEELWQREQRSYSIWVVEELERQGVPPPEEREAFRLRLDAHAHRRKNLDGPFTDPSQICELVEGAGFSVERLMPIEVDVVGPYRQYLSEIDTRRFMALAKPRP
jgi:SAM-dependent methyltransferase